MQDNAQWSTRNGAGNEDAVDNDNHDYNCLWLTSQFARSRKAHAQQCNMQVQYMYAMNVMTVELLYKYNNTHPWAEVINGVKDDETKQKFIQEINNERNMTTKGA